MKRIKYVDTIKGLAIFLVVIGHMITGFLSSGLYQSSKDALMYIHYTIYTFHMPLFFLVSGLLYSTKKKMDSRSEYLIFLKKKSKSLIIPYLLFSWIQIGIKLIMSKSVNSEVSPINFITILIEPIEQFWFLYALMIIFIIIAYLDYKIRNDKIIGIIVFTMCLLVRVIPLDFGILGIALYNIIFFYLGRFAIKFIEKYKYDKKIMYSTFVSYVILNICMYIYDINNIIMKTITSLIAIALIVLVCEKVSNKTNVLIKALDIMGAYSMEIFLLHIILGSGIRVILMKLSITNFAIQLIAGLVFGIVIPIIIGLTYNKLKKNNKLLTTISS